MKDGFVKIAARSLPVSLADCGKNAETIAAAVAEAGEAGVQILCLQELGLTGASCGDLFGQRTLQEAVLPALETVLQATCGTETLVVLGFPLSLGSNLYNCAAVLQKGRILGVVPKTYGVSAPFSPAPDGVMDISLLGQTVPFGTELLFSCHSLPELKVAVELGEDLLAPISPSAYAALAGATVICRPAADLSTAIPEDDTDLLEKAILAHSKKLCCTYLTTSAGLGESSTDMVFRGDSLMAEDGELVSGETDVQYLCHTRRKNPAFVEESGGFVEIPMDFQEKEIPLTRILNRYPLCGDPGMMLDIQIRALSRRLEHTHAKTVVLGLSGGLDSTQALLAAVHAMDAMERPRTDILAVSMPCFGTTDRTKSNAQQLAEALGVRFREIPIGDAVHQHFKDIGLSPDDRSTTYENAQARERTQILMDLSGMEGGMVLGTGDLSELALGWCTYNGDHMSMYAINAGITKTALQEMVREEIYLTGDQTVASILKDILETPISPELLPPEEGKIAQKTEDLVGPYELHDFFLYHLLHNGFSPRKIYRLACHAWQESDLEEGAYDEETILHWLKTFVRRFFSQQFKRSCMPDGPAVGDVSLSPRGGWQMPSDACVTAWLRELETL